MKLPGFLRPAPDEDPAFSVVLWFGVGVAFWACIALALH